MSRISIAFQVLLTAALLLGGSLIAPYSTGDEEPSREPGDVIKVNNDTELEDLADANGWPGDGSEGDPFIIEDLEINGSSDGYCIFISNTTHHVIIRDSVLHDAGNMSDIPSGLFLNNTSNVIIDNVTCRDNGEYDGVGIIAMISNNITIRNSRFLNNGGNGEGSVGIYLPASVDISIQNCKISSDAMTEFSFGIYAEGSQRISIKDVAVHNNTALSEAGGIYLGYSSFATIERCILHDNSAMNSIGIYIIDTDNVTIRGSSVKRNHRIYSSFGIKLDAARNVNIQGNHLEDQTYGIRMDDSDNCVIRDNRFMNHSIGFFLWNANDNWIENNTLVDTVSRNFGSCPFLYTWNGDGMEMIGDVNGMGGLGYRFDMTSSGGSSLERRPPTSKDYTAIDASQLIAEDGTYVMEIVEEQDEITYFDEAELWVIDHSPDVEIYNPEAALCTFEKDLFEPVIHTVKNPIAPVSATDWYGNDILEVVSEADGVYTDAELLNDNFITMDLGDLSGAQQIKLVYNAYTDWSPIGELKENVYAEVIGTDGEWELVSDQEHLGKPEALPRTWVMDITDWFRTDDYRVRLHTGNIKIHVDWIAVDTSVDEPVSISILEPIGADHYFKGPTHPNFENFQGRFTKYGDVMPLLEETDDKYVIMKDGDAVELRFQEQSPPAQDRDFILVTDAYFKQPFVKYILGESFSSVDPLPFHGMSNYPYPDDEAYPDDMEHQEYLDEWNTRESFTQPEFGMSLPFSDNNTVIRNRFLGGETATLIHLESETNCSIIENELIGGRIGFQSYSSENVLVKDNIIKDNERAGISLGWSSQVEITGNWIVNNTENGLLSRYSDNMTVYNNYFENELNWNLTDTVDVVWNITLKEGENIIGGNLLGGNFWSDYAGMDLNGDMIGDTLVPYGPGDMLPLAFETISPEIIDLTTGTPTSGEPFDFTADASDLGGIQGVYLEYWSGSGAHTNVTMEEREDMPFISTVPVMDDEVEILYKISAVDLSGNWADTGMKNITVVDNDAPVFYDLNYPDRIGIGDDSNVSVRIEDNIGVENVQFVVHLPNLDGMEINHTVDGDLYHAELPILDEMGWMNISITASDMEGNMNWSMGTLYVIDDIAPQIEMLNPSDGSHVSGQIGIAANISDIGSGIDRVAVNVSGNELFNDTVSEAAPFIFVWNTTDVDDGEHEIILTVWDKAENSVSSSVMVYVKNNFTQEEQLKIVSTDPADREVDVPVDTTIQVVFSVPVDTSRVFISATGAPEYTIGWNDNDTIMHMMFHENLSFDTVYTIYIDSAFSKIAAPLLGAPYEITFTTVLNSTGDDDDDVVDDDDTTDDDSDDDTADDDDDDTSEKEAPIGLWIGLILVILLLIIIVVVLVLRRSGSDDQFEE